MKHELEAKIKIDDPEKLRKTMTQAGAIALAMVKETNTYFDNRDLELKCKDEGLRIRVERWPDGRQITTVTHKGPRTFSEYKRRLESECTVQGPREAALLLRALGYRPVISFEKRREHWSLGECEIGLDQIPTLGYFLEVEGPGEEEIHAVLTQFGMQDSPTIKASYIAMLSNHEGVAIHPSRSICFGESCPIG